MKRGDTSGEEFLGTLSSVLNRMGGVLRCKVDPPPGEARHERPLGDIEEYRRDGWPKCCGQTMTWYTARELEENRRRPFHGRPREE